MGWVRRRACAAIAASILLSCGEAPDQAVVVLPDALFDGAFASAIVLAQGGPAVDQAVVAAWAVDLENPAPLFMERQDGELAIRVLAYPDPLSLWGLEPGPLRGATDVDKGSALPRPAASLVALVDLDQPEPTSAWSEEVIPTDMSKISWRIPAIDPCAWVVPEVSVPPGFETDTFQGFLELEDGRFIVSGHRSFGQTIAEQLGFVGQLQDFDRYDSFIEDLPAQEVRRIVRSPWGIFASTTHGDLVSIDAGVRSATTTRVIDSEYDYVRWTLSVGEDGQAMMFSRPDEIIDETDQARWIDLQSKTARPVDTPELFDRVAVVNAASVLGAREGAVYHYDGQSWTKEREGPPVRDIEAINGGRFVLITIGGGLAVRDADGQWIDWPQEFPGGLVSNYVRRLPGDRWLIASDAGLATVWMDDRWCQVLTGVGRTFFAVELSADGKSAWLAAYSSRPDAPARVAQIRIERSPLEP